MPFDFRRLPTGPGAARRIMAFAAPVAGGFLLSGPAGAAVAAGIAAVAHLFATARRASARARALETALAHMNQGLIMVDDEGRLVVTNARAGELLGLPDRLIASGTPFAEVASFQLEEYGLTDPKMREAVIAAALNIGHSTTERARPNGMVLEVDSVPLGKGFIRTYTDITQRKKDAAELAKAKERAEADGRAKEAFFAMMSYEMRTPLNGVIGLADVLADSDLGPQERLHVRMLQDSAADLLGIINDLLDFSKMRSEGGFRLESAPFDLGRIVEQSVATVSHTARGNGIEVRCEIGEDVPRRLVGDGARLKQVLLNLLGNGVKFTASGHVAIAVSCMRADEKAATLRMRIEDTGIGIAPAAVPKLFNAFSQVDASISRRFGGTGLGLAISQKIVQAMGAEIAVESEEGRGTAFTFEIALSRDDGSLASSAEEAPQAVGSRRILLADDNETNCFVGRTLLEKMGHVVDVVHNGREAVEAASAGGYDLVLMDVMMPEMDGLAAARAIRVLPEPVGAVPILALTANTLSHHVEAITASGMDGAVAKPVTRAALERAVSRILCGGGAAAPTAGQAPDSEAQALPVLERSVLDELFSEVGDEAARKMITVFMDNAQESVRGLAKLAQDAAALERFAHSLKSSAGIFGFARLSRLAADLEAEAHGTPDPEKSIGCLAQALEEARRELKAA